MLELLTSVLTWQRWRKGIYLLIYFSTTAENLTTTTLALSDVIWWTRQNHKRLNYYTYFHAAFYHIHLLWIGTDCEFRMAGDSSTSKYYCFRDFLIPRGSKTSTSALPFVLFRSLTSMSCQSATLQILTDHLIKLPSSHLNICSQADWGIGNTFWILDYFVWELLWDYVRRLELHGGFYKLELNRMR